MDQSKGEDKRGGVEGNSTAKLGCNNLTNDDKGAYFYGTQRYIQEITVFAF